VVAPAAGDVVLVPFPFSDLSAAKVRPSVCLADAGRGDWVLCQITSSPYSDPIAQPSRALISLPAACPLQASRGQASSLPPTGH
jgi:hypothetical protein